MSRRRRRLCMVVHGPYPIGEARVPREVQVALEEGFEVDIVAMSREGEPAVEEVEGARVIRLPLSHQRGVGVGAIVREYLAFTLLASMRVARLSLRHRYDVVHVHNPPDFLIAAALVPKLLGARVVLDVHDLAPDMFAMRFEGRREARLVDRVLRGVTRWAGWVADAVVTVHEPYRQELVARGIPAEKTTIVMNSLDERLVPADPAPAPNGCFRIVYHGRVTPHYGLDVVVEATARLAREVPDVRLEVFGEGDALPSVLAKAQELGIADIVVASDSFLPQSEVLGRVRGASVGVVPNLPIRLNRYALPTKLLEYVALGVPVVASDLPTIRGHFSEEGLRFFRAGDVDALAAALLETARNPEEARRRARSAREQYEPYRWEMSGRRYAELLRALAPTGESSTPTAAVPAPGMSEV